VQRIDDLLLRRLQPRDQVILAVGVHQEADRAAVHPVDRCVDRLRGMQRRQHEPVAPQRHDHVRLFGAK
jgi:hypothetical protein